MTPTRTQGIQSCVLDVRGTMKNILSSIIKLFITFHFVRLYVVSYNVLTLFYDLIDCLHYNWKTNLERDLQWLTVMTRGFIT